MNDLFEQIQQWQAAGRSVALATVVKVYGSSPRPLGAKMAVSAEGEMVGSVSGGCVESAVLQEALAVLETGQAKLVEYGIGDDWAQGVGLACGGNIEVFIGDASFMDTLSQALKQRQLAALATVLAGPEQGNRMLIWPDGRAEGSLGREELDRQVIHAGIDLLERQQPARRQFLVAGEPRDVFIEVFLPPPRLIVVGAVHVAIPLVKFAKELGFHTTVIDARGIFATPARFAHADQLIQRWPDEALAALALDEASYVVVLSHDDKLDIPALQVALASKARYVGALGSRKTMAKRARRLRELGVTEEQLARVFNPIGLDLGGRAAEEIALAIMAEIVAVRYGRRRPDAS